MLKQINKNIYLDDVEINILNKYNVAFQSAKTYDEILLLIDNASFDELTNEELDELDYVANLVSERKYYTQIKK